jgi:hypothetical protein
VFLLRPDIPSRLVQDLQIEAPESRTFLRYFQESFNVRLTEDRPCMLVIMGSLENGTKEL